MAAVTLTPVNITVNGVSFGLLSLNTLVPGAGSGVNFTYDDKLTIFLSNPTVGDATFTLKVAAIPTLTSLGLTTPDKTYVVATGETWIIPPLFAFRDANGLVTIECDVAAQVGVYLRP